MKERELGYLVSEYVQLWDQYGIEDLKPKRKVLAQKLSSKSMRSRSLPKVEKPVLSSLVDVQSWLGDCKRCGLCQDRSKIVFGSGNPNARLLFIGEGPGEDEDIQGLPFVGKCGQLLTKIIEAMGYTRESVYIANIVKCRPPNNRLPETAEIEKCMPFLRAQIELIKPEMIVALGLTASKALTGKDTTMANLRSKFHPLHWNSKIPVMATYHPAYLLRSPDAKRLVWDDMKQVKMRMEK